MSQELEVYIVTSLDSLANWKIPFDGFGVSCLVKAYLDQEKLKIKYFKNFVKCITDNVKASRAEFNEDVIIDYIERCPSL